MTGGVIGGSRPHRCGRIGNRQNAFRPAETTANVVSQPLSDERLAVQRLREAARLTACAGHLPQVPPVPHTGKPVIAILVAAPPAQDSVQGAIHTTGGRLQAYADAVQQNGGTPYFVWDDGRSSQDLLKGVHGVLIPGGPDINPSLYGQQDNPRAHLHKAPLKFDRWQKHAVQAAIEAKLPIRGVCRGHQLLNIINGGTLKQDITPHRPRSFPYTVNHLNAQHALRVQPGSHLSGITRATVLDVNSFHHQALARIGRGYRITATAPDGIVEAIENADGSILGVQFHPERDHSPVGSNFFTDLVHQASTWQHLNDPTVESALGLDQPLAAPATSASPGDQEMGVGAVDIMQIRIRQDQG